MKYMTAIPDMSETIYDILHTTIHTVYPKYYPEEVADFSAGITVRNTFWRVLHLGIWEY